MATPNKTKKRNKFRNWKIFNTNSGSSYIANHKLLLPTCNSTKYVSLSIPLKGKLKRFYKSRFKGSRLKQIFKIMGDIHKNAKKSCNIYNPQMGIIQRIFEIIPKEFFGCLYHRKLFFKIVKKILTRSIYECVLIRSIVRHYNFDKIPWLKGFNQAKHLQYFYFPLLWVFQVVKYVIRRNYYFLKSSYLYEIQLVPHNIWNRFKQRALNNIIQKKYAVAVNVPANEVRGVVHLIPKEGLDKLKYRPILRLYQKGSKSPDKKPYIKIINDYATKLSQTKTKSFYNYWGRYVWFVKGKQIFCVKVDVSDAYGRVRIDVLTDLIHKMNISIWAKQILITHITDQFVAFRNPTFPRTQTYRWTHGLLQGDQLSASFCELYMSSLDSTYLTGLYNQNNFIHRTVDDYLFASTDPQEVKNFIKIMKRVHILKHSKIISNVLLSDCSRSERILYCGLIIDTNTKEITPHFNVKPNTTLHAKFRVWNTKVPVNHKNFIIRAMRYQYNNYYFRNVFLNLNYNSENTTMRNYFNAMVNLAFKFDVAVSAIYNHKEIKEYGEVAGDIVIQYARKALKTIRRNSLDNKKNNIRFALLVKIGYYAFQIVLRKKSMYNIIVKEIKKVNNIIHIKKPFNAKNYKKLPKCFAKIRMARKIKIRYK